MNHIRIKRMFSNFNSSLSLTLKKFVIVVKNVSNSTENAIQVCANACWFPEMPFEKQF